MRRKLFRSTLLISAIVLTIFGIIGAIAVDIWYSDMLVAEMKREITLIASGLPAPEQMNDYVQVKSTELSDGGNEVRITVIDSNGVVMGDSSADWTTMENHKDRPEVQAALAKGWGTSQRPSDTLKVRMLYVAHFDNSRQTVVRAAMPMYDIQKIYGVLACFLLACILLSLGIAALLARNTSKQLAQPMVSLLKMTHEIASGNYEVEEPVTKELEFSELSSGLKKLAHDLSEHVNALENSNAQLSTVLSSINEGLVAIDGNGNLLFINHAACTMLGLGDSTGLIGQKASVVLPSKQLCDVSDDCLKEKRAASVEITLPFDSLLVQASASPMRDLVSGCILLLVDITQLRKLENMRRDFVSNVTHELRTPLTSIRGYVESLQGAAIDKPELSKKFLQIIEIESERLSNLINDLLYLSEIESIERDRGIKHIQLASIANSVIEVIEIAAKARNVTVESSVDNDILIDGNPDRIKQLLLNLVDNAVKYNHEGGNVLISAEKARGFVRISVKDTGIGISEEHATRIFERFYRVDKGRSRSMGGTGLGLSIVKHIVNLYHGNIRLSSEAGKGSEFIIEMPVSVNDKKKIR